MNWLKLVTTLLPLFERRRNNDRASAKDTSPLEDLIGAVVDGGEEDDEDPQPTLTREEPIGRGELPRISGVVATTWLNRSDDRSGATAEQPAYPWAPRYYDGVGLSLFGAAVPMEVNEGDKLRIRRVFGEGRDPGAWFLAPIIEKGPHHTTDRYLVKGTRPAAESEGGNRAGVDCTPPLMAKLLGVSTEAAYTGEMSCTVEVQLVRGTPESGKLDARSPSFRAVEAARALPKPFPYAKETNAGELGCAQVITTALVNARLLKRVRLAVVEARRDLEAAGWRPVPAGAPLQPADVVVWAPTPTGTHKHIGLITSGSPGPVVLHNSSAERRVVERPLTTVARPVEVVLRMP